MPVDEPEQPEEEAPLAPRHEEWHVTVEGDPLAWATFCQEREAKPLYIELSDRRLQLLSALSFDPEEDTGAGCSFLDEATAAGFKVVRLKHEVSTLRPGEIALYYEAHAKFDGPFRHDQRSSSRELYRGNRWYLTRREAEPFSLEQFEAATRLMSKPSKFVGSEYEVCIFDSNPALDDGWLR
jgi:hypothetical protein